MNTILAPLRELGEYEDIQKQLNTQQGKVSISGCVDSQKLHMVYGLTEKYDVKLIVTYSDMKAKELLETIQSNAIKCFDYMKENNAILNELVFQRAPAELTSAEIASLQEFADKMFNYASSEDCGIAYKVYSLLLENARIRGDKPAIVRYLYGKAVSLHYLNVRGRDYAINPYGTQVRGLFQEGAGYIAEYESFDKTTKGYIMRCLGNSRMSMPRSTPEE